jgi:hypothetical protein
MGIGTFFKSAAKQMGNRILGDEVFPNRKKKGPIDLDEELAKDNKKSRARMVMESSMAKSRSKLSV